MSTSTLQLLQAAFLQSWNSIVITDAKRLQVEFANPAFCAMTGYTMEELQGRTLRMLQGPDTDRAVIEHLHQCLNEARYFEGTATNYRKDGSSYLVHWNISPVRGDDGALTHFISVQQDVSAYIQSERKNRLLARALDAASDPVMLTDAAGRIIFVNTAFSHVTGYGADEVMGATPAVLRSGLHDEVFYSALHRSLAEGRDFRATFVNRRRDGSLFHAEQSISPVCDERGQVTHYVSVSKDISERVSKEQALLDAATRDPLTGLHNRRGGEKILAEAQADARKHGRPLSLLVCDIDHFKRVNDRFGHPAGDRVLRDVACMLRLAVRSRDAVIRWGGEEFVIVLDSCPEARAAELAERIRGRVEAHRDAEVGALTLSMGLATLLGGETVQQLVGRADAALYDAKRGGRNRWSVARPGSGD